MKDGMILQLDSIKKVYRPGSGVFGINMNIHSGEIHGFLGQNGAGKTTTMKCIMGLISYDAGSMSMFGEEYNPGNWKLKTRIGFMPEILTFPPYLTALEVMLTYGRIRGIEKGTLAFQAEILLEKVGLTEVKHGKVGAFSKGTISKLGIAFSMIGNPDLLILDEPTSGLDPVSKAAIHRLFKEIVKDGKTIVLSSHQLQDVENLCDSVTVINRGLTVAEGPTEMLRKKGGVISYRAEFSKVDNRLLSGLSSLEGVTSVDEIEGKNMVRVIVEGERDVREMLAKEAVALGNAMLSCEEEKETLEELFFQLIT